MNYETKKLSVVVKPVGEPIFSEQATTITIVDESGGEYVEISQSARDDIGKIAINPDEWPTLRDVIDEMIGACK